MSRPPLPPFTEETAREKVRLAEDGWNTRDAAKVALAYTLDTKWRNRAHFVTNRAEAQAFLEDKWKRELDYRLIKELWAFTGNRIAVRYAYEWHDDSGNWFRSYGNEKLGVRGGRSDETPLLQHQRSADQRERPQIPLDARAPARRSPRPFGPRPIG